MTLSNQKVSCMQENNQKINIDPTIWKNRYAEEVKEYPNRKEEYDLIIEENTIYEIDQECLECRKGR